MGIFFFVLSLVAFVRSADVNYTVTIQWSSSDCQSGTELVFAAIPSTTSPCDTNLMCVASNQGSVQGVSIQCVEGIPTVPSAITSGVTTWLSPGCTGNPQTIAGYAPGCITQGSQSYLASCNPGFLLTTFTSSSCGNPSSTPSELGCISGTSASSEQFGCGGGPGPSPSSSGSGGGGGGGGSSSCFHEDTIITYKGENYNLADISKHPECAIPHNNPRDGVKISTTCPGFLRLTVDHLVETEAGYVQAGDLRVGDQIFQGPKGCKVTHMETEFKQNYFGLNCVESEVLANGYKTSTFGVVHTAPAIWMKYVSKLVGISAASSLGDSIATLIKKLGVL